MCTYWNNKRYVGDQITQMIWLRKFKLPIITPQTLSTIKLSFYLPMIQIHRFYQMISADPEHGYGSLKNYRNVASKRTTFEQSIGDVQEILLEMRDKSIMPSQIQTSNNDHHPTTISNNGVTEQNWNSELTGSNPKINMLQFNKKEVNSIKPAFS